MCQFQDRIIENMFLTKTSRYKNTSGCDPLRQMANFKAKYDFNVQYSA